MDEASSPRAPRALRAACVLALLLLAAAGAWNHDLWTYDEPREAELARAMWRSGNHAYTVLGERPFLEKPPLFSITVALAFQALGHASVFAGRLVAAAWANVAVLFVAWFARRELGEGAGLLAALVLATTARFFIVAHTLLLDDALVALTTGALVVGWVAARERRRGLAALFGLLLGGAFLAKGVIGPGVAVLVLGLDLALRRDGRGLLALLHPFAVVGALVPVLAYTAVLFRAGGTEGREFVTELLWKNQLGRFFSGYASRPEHWYLYAKTWPDMLGAWAPFALLAIAHHARTATRGAAGEKARALSTFLLIWAVAPLVLLSISKARARTYALPVTPAYALLVTSWWQAEVRGRELPAWAQTALGALAWVGTVGILGGAAVLASRGGGDALTLGGGLLALGVAGGLVLIGRRPRAASSETGALLVSLLVVAGLFLYASSSFARQGDASRSYRALAQEVLRRAGERRLLLFHANDSWSGQFAFEAGRSTPEFNEAWDPLGERLLAAIGPATSDVVLAPEGALLPAPGDQPERRRALEALRAALVPEPPRLLREDDREHPEKTFVLLHRRAPGEADPPRGEAEVVR